MFEDKNNDEGGEDEVADDESHRGHDVAGEGWIPADAPGGEVAADDADARDGATNQGNNGETGKSLWFGAGGANRGQRHGGGEGLGRDGRGGGGARLGNDQRLVAGGAGELPARKAAVAQDFLAAIWAVEFKSAHGIFRPSINGPNIGSWRGHGKGQMRAGCYGKQTRRRVGGQNNQKTGLAMAARQV